MSPVLHSGFWVICQVTLVLLNWSAPATLADLAREHQALAFAQLVTGSSWNLGVVFSPVFHYKKHQMHVLEHMVLKSLAARGLDVDAQAALLFKERKDARDGRPLVYPLRLVRPVGAVLPAEDGEVKGAKKESPGAHWTTASLLRKGRTEEAEQVPAPKLKQVEDLTDTALPLTTDISGSVCGGRRFEQIGVSAACKVLESLLDFEMPAKATGVCIVDLTPGVGDFFWAWLQRHRPVS